MQTIFLVRHGETQWNVEGRLQGQVQHVRLNKKGVRQSKLLAKRLAKEKIDMIYSSPLERALQTAEMIAEPHGLAIITHAGLSERSHGIMDGLTREEIRKNHPEVWKVYEATRELPGVDGAETKEQLARRAFHAFMEIARQGPGKNIVVVSHGAVNKAIISRLTGIERSKIRQHNCCINIIKHGGKNCTDKVRHALPEAGAFFVEKINDTAQLKRKRKTKQDAKDEHSPSAR